MTKQLYHTNIPESPDAKPRVHPSITPHLVAISFSQLTPETARDIVADDIDNVFEQFVRDARFKGDLR